MFQLVLLNLHSLSVAGVGEQASLAGGVTSAGCGERSGWNCGVHGQGDEILLANRKAQQQIVANAATIVKPRGRSRQLKRLGCILDLSIFKYCL